MASPEAICGNCKFFDKTDANGNTIEPIGRDKGKVDIGFCRAPTGLVFGDREPKNKCSMPEGTFEAVSTSFTQNPSALQESQAL